MATVNKYHDIICALMDEYVELETSSRDDIKVEAVIDQVAQTAENLRLFDDTRKRASREQAIREITDKLRAAPNLESLMDIATKEISQQLSATHAKLDLGIETQQAVTNGGSGHAEGE